MAVAVGSSTYSIKHILGGMNQNPSLTQSLISLHPTKMADAERRRRSFVFWPSSALVNLTALADAGFYSTGNNDEVRCFSCGVTHKHWQKLDDPVGVHLRLNPSCSFIREKASTLTNNSNSSGRRRRTTRQRRRRNSVEDDDDVSPARTTSQTGTDDVAQFNIQSRAQRTLPRATDPVVKEMSELNNRLKSYSGNWKKDYPVTKEDLANAGLFYKGPGDRVQCAFCKGILKGWEVGDSALGEHTRHFPGCPHVAQMNREPSRVHQLPAVRVLLRMDYAEKDVVDAAMRLRKKGISEPSTDALIEAVFELQDEQCSREVTSSKSIKHVTSTQPPEPAEFAELVKLREENKALKDSARCKVCLDSNVEVLLLPCRHLVCCSQCVERVDLCPVCRAEILGTVRIYHDLMS